MRTVAKEVFKNVAISTFSKKYYEEHSIFSKVFLHRYVFKIHNNLAFLNLCGAAMPLGKTLISPFKGTVTAGVTNEMFPSRFKEIFLFPQARLKRNTETHVLITDNNQGKAMESANPGDNLLITAESKLLSKTNLFILMEDT